MKAARLALVGDFNPGIAAHASINQAVALFRAAHAGLLETAWISTGQLRPGDETLLRGLDGVWCVPGSPYQNTAGALWAIQFARTHRTPFLGTCGGYQHALLEYVRHVLGRAGADHQELRPESEFSLLTRLSCPLLEKSEMVLFPGPGRLRAIYGREEAGPECYHCSYGLNPAHEFLFQNTALKIAARSPQGLVRAVELEGHPFFIGVAFQPERSSLEGKLHPLVNAFFLAAVERAAGAGLSPAPGSLRPSIRRATARDTDSVVAILREAARWVEASGRVMWRDSELVPARLAADVEAGLIYLAECGGEAAGTVKFQLDDAFFWPDVPAGESAFLHRLAVRRRWAGTGVSRALLDWAVARAGSLGKRWLRLDCEASRPRLRAFYESIGFKHHSDREVGPYFVSRYEMDLRHPARSQTVFKQAGS
jgi:GNAT superfamily N-acetyltransferase